MNSLYILLPVALLFTVIALTAFFWAVGHQQFDDLDAAGERILFDEEESGDSPVKQQEHE